MEHPIADVRERNCAGGNRVRAGPIPGSISRMRRMAGANNSRFERGHRAIPASTRARAFRSPPPVSRERARSLATNNNRGRADSSLSLIHISVIVMLFAKFVEGAWITLLFIPLTIVFFTAVRRHYHSVKMRTTCKVPIHPESFSEPPIAVIPIDRWSKITRQGIEFAARLSPEVIALHVELTDHSELLQENWERYVAQPFRCLLYTSRCV